jgi:hypothetical protein
VLRSEFEDPNSWYVDKLLHNYDFACKPLYKICKFIYMIRSPEVPLATLIMRGYPPAGAENHYLFRLRRMCEMAVHTDGVLLTYEDLVKRRAFPLLKNSLGLKSDLLDNFTPFDFDDINMNSGKILKNPTEPDVDVPEDVVKRCVTGYHKYLRFMDTKTGLIRFAT